MGIHFRKIFIFRLSINIDSKFNRFNFYFAILFFFNLFCPYIYAHNNSEQKIDEFGILKSETQLKLDLQDEFHSSNIKLPIPIPEVSRYTGTFKREASHFFTINRETPIFGPIWSNDDKNQEQNSEYMRQIFREIIKVSDELIRGTVFDPINISNKPNQSNALRYSMERYIEKNKSILKTLKLNKKNYDEEQRNNFLRKSLVFLDEAAHEVQPTIEINRLIRKLKNILSVFENQRPFDDENKTVIFYNHDMFNKTLDNLIKKIVIEKVQKAFSRNFEKEKIFDAYIDNYVYNYTYYSFLVLALATLEHESRFLHFKWNTGDNCTQSKNDLTDISQDGRFTMGPIYRNSNTMIFPDCNYLDDKNPVIQLLASGKQFAVGIGQVVPYHHPKGIEPHILLNVKSSIRYALKYLFEKFIEFRTNYQKYTKRFGCDYHGSPYENTIETRYYGIQRVTWSGGYKWGGVEGKRDKDASKIACLEELSKDEKNPFQKDLDNIVKSGKSLIYKYLPDGIERQAFYEIIHNYQRIYTKRKAEKNNALNTLLEKLRMEEQRGDDPNNEAIILSDESYKYEYFEKNMGFGPSRPYKATHKIKKQEKESYLYFSPTKFDPNSNTGNTSPYFVCGKVNKYDRDYKTYTYNSDSNDTHPLPNEYYRGLRIWHDIHNLEIPIKDSDFYFEISELYKKSPEIDSNLENQNEVDLVKKRKYFKPSEDLWSIIQFPRHISYKDFGESNEQKEKHSKFPVIDYFSYEKINPESPDYLVSFNKNYYGIIVRNSPDTDLTTSSDTGIRISPLNNNGKMPKLEFQSMDDHFVRVQWPDMPSNIKDKAFIDKSFLTVEFNWKKIPPKQECKNFITNNHRLNRFFILSKNIEPLIDNDIEFNFKGRAIKKTGLRFRPRIGSKNDHYTIRRGDDLLIKGKVRATFKEKDSHDIRFWYRVSFIHNNEEKFGWLPDKSVELLDISEQSIPEMAQASTF